MVGHSRRPLEEVTRGNLIVGGGEGDYEYVRQFSTPASRRRHLDETRIRVEVN